MSRVGTPFALAGLLAVYLLLAAWVPPFDDEIYYWCWAQKLQLSYFDHPPMTAYFLWPSLQLFGDSVLAIRLPACLASVVIVAILANLTRPRSFLLWAFATPMFTFGAVLITPDTPLLVFWAAYLGWLVAVHRRLTPIEGEPRPIPAWMWLLGGVILGCGGLGKYTCVLAVPAGFVSFLLAGRVPVKRWLPGYVGHGVIAGAMVVPVFLFNWEHDFAPMRFQWEHANRANRQGLGPFFEFVGVQIALVGALPIILLPWVWRNRWMLVSDPCLRVCATMYAIPLAFFLFKATRGHLEGNWAMACYLGFWPVAACWYATQPPTRSRRWVMLGAFALPVGCLIVATVHLAVSIPFIPANQDRVMRQAVRMDIAERAAAEMRERGELPVYVATYQWAALLRYQGLDARQIDGASRPSNFTLNPETMHTAPDEVYVFNEGPLPLEMAPGYGWPELIVNYPVTLRGTTTGYVQLYRYTREPPCEDCGPVHAAAIGGVSQFQQAPVAQRR